MYINVQCASLNLKLVKANWCRAVWLILCWEILFGKEINWMSGFFGALCKGSLRKIAIFCGFPSYSDVKIFYSVQSFIHKWLEPYFEEKTAEMFEKGVENCWKIVQIIYWYLLSRHFDPFALSELGKLQISPLETFKISRIRRKKGKNYKFRP